MTSQSAATAAAAPTTAAPMIAGSTNTSSPVLDLSKQRPFTITVTLVLNYKHPITFDTRFAGLFNGRLMHKGGLQFTDVASGEAMPQNERHVQYESSNGDGTPSPTTKDQFTTLYPGEETTLELTLTPFLAAPLFNTDGLTLDQIVEKRDALGKTWKWYNVSGFEDSGVYEIGVSENAVVQNWMQGSLDELLAAKKLGMRPERKTEAVRFVVGKAARFEVKRPYKAEGWDWP
jgi:hypothetical protein